MVRSTPLDTMGSQYVLILGGGHHILCHNHYVILLHIFSSNVNIIMKLV